LCGQWFVGLCADLPKIQSVRDGWVIISAGSRDGVAVSLGGWVIEADTGLQTEHARQIARIEIRGVTPDTSRGAIVTPVLPGHEVRAGMSVKFDTDLLRPTTGTTDRPGLSDERTHRPASNRPGSERRTGKSTFSELEDRLGATGKIDAVEEIAVARELLRRDSTHEAALKVVRRWESRLWSMEVSGNRAMSRGDFGWAVDTYLRLIELESSRAQGLERKISMACDRAAASGLDEATRRCAEAFRGVLAGLPDASQRARHYEDSIGRAE
jgi:hypothetical protein